MLGEIGHNDENGNGTKACKLSSSCHADFGQEFIELCRSMPSCPVQVSLACGRLSDLGKILWEQLRLSSIPRKFRLLAHTVSATEFKSTGLVDTMANLIRHSDYQHCETKGIIERVTTVAGRKKAAIAIDRDKRKRSNPRRHEGPLMPFCKSQKWQIQQQYYANRLLSAWETEDVPSQISSNAFVGDMYFNMICSMLTALQPKNTRKTGDFLKVAPKAESRLKVAVVEIGAGHGVVSYLLAKRAYDYAASSARGTALGTMGDCEIKVICTDFHDGVFKSHLELPWIRWVVGKFPYLLDSSLKRSYHHNPQRKAHSSFLNLIAHALSTVYLNTGVANFTFLFIHIIQSKNIIQLFPISILSMCMLIPTGLYVRRDFSITLYALLTLLMAVSIPLLLVMVMAVIVMAAR